MAKVTKFDAPTVNNIGTASAAALQAFAASHGLKVSYAGGAIGALESVVKLSFKIDDAAAMTAAARAEWLKYCGRCGFNPTDFGRTFTVRNVQYRVAGLNISRPAFRIRAVAVVTGATTNFGEDVLRLLEA